MQQFSSQQEIWQWLIDGGEITEPFKSGCRKIKLINGNPFFEDGSSAKNCLFSHDYWEKVLPNT